MALDEINKALIALQKVICEQAREIERLEKEKEILIHQLRFHPNTIDKNNLMQGEHHG